MGEPFSWPNQEDQADGHIMMADAAFHSLPPARNWGDRFVGRFRSRRAYVLVAVDVIAWAFALVLATWARYEGHLSRQNAKGTAALILVAAVLVAGLGRALELYRGRHIVGSFDEMWIIARMTSVVWLVLLFLNAQFDPQLVPQSSVFLAGAVAFWVSMTPRCLLRHNRDANNRPDPTTTRRVIVVGAGAAGAEIVRALVRDANSPLLPVAMIDDDSMKRHRLIAGVPVLGDRLAIPQLARSLRADCLLVAIPSASPKTKQEFANIADSCGLEIRVLPPLSELLDATVSPRDIRVMTEADLLGRPQVDVDLEAISDYLTGKVVLITGAGGSIGSEICRQVAAFQPRAVVMLDRDESALHSVQLSIEGTALLTDDRLVVADIRDRERVFSIFHKWQPQVVFHAAALKHLPLLEMHPEEGIKTNIWGTWNVLEAALEVGVQRFINISTDKAANATSVLGYTKRIAERLTALASKQTSGSFLSVRFGNVLGSRGSVLPTFRAQIDAGGPVTVTDPEVTRYFMTIEEAVRLVMQASVSGSPGETLILQMGDPVRIDDVARRLISVSGKKIEIRYTGLRPGEKLHECLVGTDEDVEVRNHPMILHTKVPEIQLEVVSAVTGASLASVANDDSDVLTTTM